MSTVLPDKLAYGFPDDQKYKSDDAWHRVWVTDIGDKIARREAEGYRRYMEGDAATGRIAEEVRVIVGADRTAVLMEIPQARYQAMVSLAVPGMPDGSVLWSMNPRAPIWRPDPLPTWSDEVLVDRSWSPWRIFHFPAQDEPFRGLFNFTRGDRSLRLVLRYHNDRYWYVRLRWRPWKWTCELRRRETEDDRLDRKYGGGKPEPEYEIKSKW